MTQPMVRPILPAVTDRFYPIGGVSTPISMLTIRMMPNRTGSMPNLVAMEKRIGAMISRMAAGSMQLPASSRLTTIRNDYDSSQKWIRTTRVHPLLNEQKTHFL